MSTRGKSTARGKRFAPFLLSELKLRPPKNRNGRCNYTFRLTLAAIETQAAALPALPAALPRRQHLLWISGRRLNLANLREVPQGMIRDQDEAFVAGHRTGGVRKRPRVQIILAACEISNRVIAIR